MVHVRSCSLSLIKWHWEGCSLLKKKINPKFSRVITNITVSLNYLLIRPNVQMLLFYNWFILSAKFVNLMSDIYFQRKKAIFRHLQFKETLTACFPVRYNFSITPKSVPTRKKIVVILKTTMWGIYFLSIFIFTYIWTQYQ